MCEVKNGHDYGADAGEESAKMLHNGEPLKRRKEDIVRKRDGASTALVVVGSLVMGAVIAFAVQKNVGWLEVAVEDALCVRMVDCPGYLGQQFASRFPVARLPPALVNLLGQAGAFHQFHAEIMVPLLFSHFVDGI